MPVAGPTRVMNIIISGAMCIKASVARTVLVNVLFQDTLSLRIGTRLGKDRCILVLEHPVTERTKCVFSAICSHQLFFALICT